ncbi:transposase [Streptomyces sp. NPDC095602]|uniref:IS701 family transposase n=1 Tax=Streptomyces sp. NPDC095602 TaxID=3155819 RepID=UPI0033189B46
MGFEGVRAERPAEQGVPEGVVDELCEELFAGFRRRDQRLRGEQYLRGLLTARGRKSARNIAASAGDGASEQGLHHFVSVSPWDWTQVRAALARCVERELGPRCWVVRSVVIPKAGRHSVGVARRFVPSAGHLVNSQEAYGVWAAGDGWSTPVNWRLRLAGRRVGGLPRGVTGAAAPECAAGAVREAGEWTDTPRRPVVADLPDLEPSALVRALRGARLPFVVAVPDAVPVAAVDPALGRRGAGPLPAGRLLRLAGPLRKPVTWADPVTGRTRAGLVAGVRVALPGAGTALLLGLWDGSGALGGPVRCWLTGVPGRPWGELLRLALLLGRVAADFAATSVDVGLVDFEGRSYAGWHRHTTLASAAQAVRTLTAAGRTAPAPGGGELVSGAPAGGGAGR